ncbi:hypothetical protein FKM82_020736 [Ascaphus truei]
MGCAYIGWTGRYMRTEVCYGRACIGRGVARWDIQIRVTHALLKSGGLSQAGPWRQGSYWGLVRGCFRHGGVARLAVG